MYLYFGGEVSFESSMPFRKVGGAVREKLRGFERETLPNGMSDPDSDPLGDTYGTEFNNISIITTILGEGLQGMWEERRLIRRKEKWADIRLEIDYDKFVAADEHTQKLLYVKNIVDSIMAVEERKKGDFEGLKLIEDILLAVNVTKEQIENL